ncbi:hypothetical protein HG531_008080 [Fusarium graminearum]|nr:hypothetical protein HG531_008080 [Fusarium graminearum]
MFSHSADAVVIKRGTTSTAGGRSLDGALHLEIINLAENLHENLLNTLEVAGALVAETLECSLEQVLLGGSLVERAGAVDGLLELLSVLSAGKDDIITGVLDEVLKFVHGGAHLNGRVHKQCHNLGVSGRALSITNHEVLHQRHDVLVLDTVDSLTSSRIEERRAHTLRHAAHVTGVLWSVEGILATSIRRSGQRHVQSLGVGLHVGSSVVAIGHVTFVILRVVARATGMVWSPEAASCHNIVVQSWVGNRTGILVWVGDEGVSLAIVRGTLPLVLVLAGSTLSMLCCDISRRRCNSAL